jgi:lipoyl(octanoyl) transferase
MLPWQWLGRVDHAAAAADQEARRGRVLAGDDAAQAVLLCEHLPVITLGRSADRGHVLATDAALAAAGVTVAATDRGGDVTYHGPGQLMVYPVVRLRGGAGVVALLAAIAGALGDVAAELGVPGAGWRRDPAGLWLDDRKLAACGLHVRRGVVVHGWAFDVATPPAMWQLINPCGLGVAGTSLAAARAARGLPPPPDVGVVAELVGPRVVRALAAIGLA